jgi:hypothetical protein
VRAHLNLPKIRKNIAAPHRVAESGTKARLQNPRDPALLIQNAGFKRAAPDRGSSTGIDMNDIRRAPLAARIRHEAHIHV